MKEKTAPKKTWLQTLRALWVPLAIGIVTVAALALSWWGRCGRTTAPP